MRNIVLADEHQGALAWLDDSLEWTRPQGRTKMTEFLNLVRDEILLDRELSESPRQTRTRANETLCAANRRV